jgi:hypothetical protein
MTCLGYDGSSRAAGLPYPMTSLQLPGTWTGSSRWRPPRPMPWRRFWERNGLMPWESPTCSVLPTMRLAAWVFAGPCLRTSSSFCLAYDQGDPETYCEIILAARAGACPLCRCRRARRSSGAAHRALPSLGVHRAHHGSLRCGRSRFPRPAAGQLPHYGTGVSLAAAGEALGVFLGAPELVAVTLTEVNPSYEPSGHCRQHAREMSEWFACGASGETLVILKAGRPVSLCCGGAAARRRERWRS